MTRGNIDLSDYAGLLEGQAEFLRMWAKPGAPMTCFIDPEALGADPLGFGVAMVSAIRHGARAYAYAVDITEQDALARIWEGFDAERGHPTSSPVSLSDKRGTH